MSTKQKKILKHSSIASFWKKNLITLQNALSNTVSRKHAFFNYVCPET